MREDQTCGPLFLEALQSFTDMSREQIVLFAKGFLCGQAEKVALGACMACMVRPSDEFSTEMRLALVETAERYGLKYMTGLDGELWLYRPEARPLMIQMFQGPHNGQSYHLMRGLLCGVPISDIDLMFHLRKGAGEPCDRAPVPDCRED